MTFGQETELPKVCFKVVNHIGYFIEQETDLRFGDQLCYFLTHWGNHRIQGTVLARHDGINRAQIILKLLRPPRSTANPLIYICSKYSPFA